MSLKSQFGVIDLVHTCLRALKNELGLIESVVRAMLAYKSRREAGRPVTAGAEDVDACPC